jgi:endonuclease/exonuclease/phosphatase family metal-dependent hydrolase
VKALAVLAALALAAAAWGETRIRVVSANLTDRGQRYSEHGIRIVRGLRPDVVLVQECNYGDGSEQAVRELAEAMVGPGAHAHREKPRGIPNAIFSRWPLKTRGVWDDPAVGDREWVHAWIDIPGNVDVFAVSVHFKAKAGFAATRAGEARGLAEKVAAKVPAGSYIMIGGDLNTERADEACLRALGEVVVVPAERPVDQAGDADTNASRRKPYDWVLANEALERHRVAVRVGPQSFENGLVFDSRVFAPLEDVPGVERGDSGVPQMQHMAVVREFLVP